MREYLGMLYAAFGITLDDSAAPDERPAFGGIYSKTTRGLIGVKHTFQD